MLSINLINVFRYALHKSTVAFLLFACISSTFAQTHYISDIQYVPVRSGPSIQHRVIHKGLRSGARIEVINPEPSDGWLNVRFGSEQTEGWIAAQYIINRPTSAILLAQNAAELERIRKNNAQLGSSSKKVTNELNTLQNELAQKVSKNQELSNELRRITTLSAGAIKLEQDYRSLVEQHERLQTENDALNAENANLKSDRRFSHMFYGAALIIAGMLMAVIIPRLRLKKRHSDWA